MSRLAGLCGPDVICGETYGLNCNSETLLGCYRAGCSSCRVDEAGALAICDDPLACDRSQAGSACSALAVDAPAECPSEPFVRGAPCCCCWGVSLSFANKGWAGCDISTHPRLNNEHPNHFGNSVGGAENYGGDWGITGSPHTECVSQCWALQDNMCWTNRSGCSP